MFPEVTIVVELESWAMMATKEGGSKPVFYQETIDSDIPEGSL